MKIVTQTSAIAKKFGTVEAIRILSGLGFDGLDFSMFDRQQIAMLDEPDYAATAEKLRREADICGVPFTQSHAPFPSIRIGNDEYNTITLERIRRAIIVSGILGVRNVIVHPVTTGDNQKDINLDFFNGLAPYCRDAGVKVALENMFAWDQEADHAVNGACSPSGQFCEYLDELDPNYFTACLDIGHVNIIRPCETAQNAIRALGGRRLTALHVHDNDGGRDQHSLPFLHSVDWPEVMRALREIGYEGDFTMEADNYESRFPKELIVDSARFMLKVARYLCSL